METEASFEQLLKAGTFLLHDLGGPRFAERFADAVPGDPATAADAMFRTLGSVVRAGVFSTTVPVGRYEKYESGDGTTCVVATAGGELRHTSALMMAVLVSDEEGPIPDLAINTKFFPNGPEFTNLTGPLGMIVTAALADTVQITFGQGTLGLSEFKYPS
jgi:hypothetical protein